MSAHSLLMVISLCVLLASTETLHGIFRASVLVPRLGKKRALKLGAISGSILAFGVCYYMVPGVGLESAGSHLLLGITLSAFMAGFDVLIGRWVMRFGWTRIVEDFNPRNGNYLSVALALLSVFPLLVFSIKAIS